MTPSARSCETRCSRGLAWDPRRAQQGHALAWRRRAGDHVGYGGLDKLRPSNMDKNGPRTINVTEGPDHFSSGWYYYLVNLTNGEVHAQMVLDVESHGGPNVVFGASPYVHKWWRVDTAQDFERMIDEVASMATNLFCKTSAASTSQSVSKPRFVENAEGTVTNTQTGLMWQKEDDARLRRFTESEQYCRELTLAGYRDWRLPMIDELRLVSSNWKQIFDRIKDDEPYWSSTILENPHWSSGESEAYGYAAKVLFSSGAENQYFLHYEYYTRAVRNIL